MNCKIFQSSLPGEAKDLQEALLALNDGFEQHRFSWMF